MRFDSVQALLQFLMVLSNLGYLAPSLDYKKDMVAKGANKHISYYTMNISSKVENGKRALILSFTYYGDEVYSIECKEH